MEVHLTEDQKSFIRQGIESGRYDREEDALREALSLWENRKRRRTEILAAVQQAGASLAQGAGRRITTRQEAAQLGETIKRRGKAKLAANESKGAVGDGAVGDGALNICKMSR